MRETVTVTYDEIIKGKLARKTCHGRRVLLIALGLFLCTYGSVYGIAVALKDVLYGDILVRSSREYSSLAERIMTSESQYSTFIFIRSES